MSTSVVWPVIGGQTYSVPAAGEVNWPALSNFLVALGTTAQSTTIQKVALRVAVVTPVTVVSASDCVIVTNLTLAGAVTVNLPAGSVGQCFTIVDGKGDAGSNNITIVPNGAETISGGASLVLNDNRMGVTLVYDQVETDWKVFGPTPGAGTAVTANNIVTLTNKTMSGDANTFSNLAIASLKTVLAQANSFLVFDNTGAPTTTSVPLPLAAGGTHQTTQGRTVYSNVAVSSNVTLTNLACHLVDTSSARSLTLPAPSVSLYIVLKDVTGSCAANNITVLPAVSQTIDGQSTSYVLNYNYGSWTIISDGTNYFII